MSCISSKFKTVLLPAKKALEDRLLLQPDNIIHLFDQFQETDDTLYDVYVQLWVKGSPRSTGVIHQTSLHKAVYQATIFALDVSCVDGQLVRSEIDQLSIEVAIKESEITIQKPYVFGAENSLNEYKHGLRIKTADNAFDLLPAQIIQKQLKTLGQQIEALLERVSLDRSIFEDSQTSLLETQWRHFVGHANSTASFENPQTLTRHRLEYFEKLSTHSMLDAAIECGTRLINTQAVDGTYLYSYQAWKNLQSNENYNVVRLAGTAFSISMLSNKLKHTHNSEPFAASANACLRYLLYLSKTTPYIPNGIYIPQEAFGLNSHTGKLGTTALTLLALQFGDFYTRYAKEREALIETVLFMQRSDGAFFTYVPTEFSMVPRFKLSSQNYFPGEALLALCYELEHGFRADIAEVIVRSFKYYRAHFSKTPDTAFVLWQVSAWVKFYNLMLHQPELHAITQNHKLLFHDVANFVYDQTDWIIRHQYDEDNTDIPEFVGGFPNDKPPHSVSSCYIEAIIRATELAALRKDRGHVERYRKSALKGLAFLRRLQIKKEEAFLVLDPTKSVGGISGTLTSFQLRNDRDQHAITAYLAAVESLSLFDTTPVQTAIKEEALL
ncbi:hypothetical protein ACFOEK_19410 [Litoribrevibacter euphylliae]|uniref:Uncharacterized protein n=1 Tax=Litoribrevibacter euphylliae TaxID=1834034 RepID=A0ABV7HKP5_9GAMM